MRKLLVLTAGVVGGGARPRHDAVVAELGPSRRRRWPLPGDDLVAEASAIETRGIEINATPKEVWPWLAQMGYGRAGWYSYDALDMNLPSPSKIDRPSPNWRSVT